jgi:hypothetical protein
MNEPEAKFFSGDKMIVSCGSVTVECQYWVQWGEQIWNVEIVVVKGKPDDDASLVEIITHALRGTAGEKLVLKREGRILLGRRRAPTADSARVV